MKNKLHLGCGQNYKKDFFNVDISNDVKTDLVLDLEHFPYPFKDNQFSEVLAIHTLEHLGNLIEVMKEIHRVCKLHAKIKLVVPFFPNYYYYADPTHKSIITYHTFEKVDFKKDNSL